MENLRRSGGGETGMNEAMLEGRFKNEFFRLASDYINERTEYGFLAMHESATDSDHVHCISVFVCDKNHDKKDLRWIDGLKRYLDIHFPGDELPDPLAG